MRIVKLTEDTKKDILTNLLKRSPDNYGSYEETVKNIVNDIHSRRDAALLNIQRNSIMRRSMRIMYV